MAFNTPTLPELIARNATDLDGSDSLRRSDAAVLARVHAAGVYGLYEYLAWQFLQHRPDTCDEDHLVRHGNDRGVSRKTATAAAGTVTMTGNAGAPVPQGTRLERGGVLYEVTLGATLAAGPTSVQVQAVDAGSVGNQPAAAQLQLVSPVLGVEPKATVDSAGLTGGTDLEPLDDFRARVVAAFRRVPHGGNADDYVMWALEQPGVTRAWVKRNWTGAGTVAVFVVNDANTPITLTAPERAAVLAGIEPKRPVTADLSVQTPTLLPVVYQLAVTPDTPTVRAAVELQLQALHQRSSELGGRIYRTHMAEAISGAAGEVDHDLISPAADVVPAAYELPVYGGVTWL
jgi:uncharacterized phage protein gp47/JayE